MHLCKPERSSWQDLKKTLLQITAYFLQTSLKSCFGFIAPCDDPAFTSLRTFHRAVVNEPAGVVTGIWSWGWKYERLSKQFWMCITIYWRFWFTRTLFDVARCHHAYDLPDSYMVMLLVWSHLIVTLTNFFSPWAPLGGGGWRLGRLQLQVLDGLNGTTRTRVRVYCANSMEKVVGCPHPVPRWFNLIQAALSREWPRGLIDGFWM